ncbi:MAG: hypothetical protein QOI98_2208 [Solirubrobacteraceae bacterium]|nr:hypothetical protein [Solirubrobacteraceae bacterium]
MRPIGSRALWARVSLALIVLLATVQVGRQGIRIHGMVFYDEKYAVEGARFLDGHLSDVISAHGYAGRGLERLTALLLLPVVWLFPSTADQFVAGHWVWAACWALLALPVYALARGLELSRRWALAAAAMAVFVPWAVFGTIFINTAPATTTAVAAIWAMWRATIRPGLATDALAVGLIGLATLARVSNAGLAIAWPVAILVQAWRDAPATEPPRARLRALPRGFARDHRLLLVATAVAGAVLAVKGVNSVIGGYPARIDFPVAELWRRLQLQVAHAATGMSFVAFIVGVAWLGRTLVAPRDRRTGAFAVLAVTAFCALVYVNHVGGYDERYEMPAVALVFVAFAAALARREVGLATPAVVGLATWVCVARFGVIRHHEAFDYINAPGRQWFSTGWIRSLSNTFGAGHGVLVAVILILATALAVALGLARGRAARVLMAVAVVGTLWSGFAGARFLMLRLPAGYRPGAQFSDLTFVDRVTGGTPAYPLIGPPRGNQLVRNTWLELQFFNRVIHRPLSIAGPSYYLCCLAYGDALVAGVDKRTGAVTVPGGDLPRFVLTTPDWVPGGLAGGVVVASSAPIHPVRVERLSSPLRATWVALGARSDGVVGPGGHIVLRAFPSGAPPRGPSCLRLTLVAPRLSPTAWRVGRVTGRLDPRRRRRLEIPLRDLSRRRRPLDVVVASRSGSTYVGVRNVGVVPCGSPDPVAKRHA